MSAKYPDRQEVFARICERVASREALRRICDEGKDLPDYTTVLKWMAEDPVLSRMYAQAREARADARADRIQELTEQCLRGEIDQGAARLAVDAEKWLASKEGPKRFGDRLEIESKTENTFTVQLIDYTGGASSKTITIAEPQKQISDYSPV